MKQVSTALNNYLNNEKHFQVADLYKLALDDGSVLYFADYDKDIVYDNHTWLHNKGLFNRDQTKLTGEPVVDTMTVTIVCDNNDKIGTVPILLAAHNGLFDGARMSLHKVYFNSNGSTAGGFELFAGKVEVAQAGGLTVKLTIKSDIQGLSQLVPARIFAPQSSYVNVDGTITESSTDVTTMLVPLKPSARVLVKI